MGERDEFIEQLRAIRVERARLDSAEMSALARLTTLDGDGDSLADELAPELRVSPVEVRRRLDRSRSLTERMPGMLRLMESGELESYAAKRVLNVTSHLDDDKARVVDELLGERLSDAPATAFLPPNLARRARRLVERADPEGQSGRAHRVRQARRLELVHGEDAISFLTAALPSEMAAACYARVDAMARRVRRDGDTERTFDQLRADAAAELLLGREPGVAVPEVKAMVYLHMPVDAALSITDHGCELDGYGPVPASIAREIMTNEGSVWRKVVCDPGTGDPVDLGRSGYRPSATIRDVIRVRDRECSIPWCHRPAQHCDHDHEVGAARDGASAGTLNSGPRCRRHHGRSNDPRWLTRYDPAHGTVAVTTPNGATHTGRREPVLDPQLRTAQSRVPRPWVPRPRTVEWSMREAHPTSGGDTPGRWTAPESRLDRDDVTEPDHSR